MKNRIFTFALGAALAGSAIAQIVIKPIRPNTPTRPGGQPGGIIVPGPDGASNALAVQKPMIIELLDGDKLRGTFVEFDADKGAKWRHAHAKADIVFEADAVSRVTLNAMPAPASAKQDCRVTLNTGEELVGELIEMTDRHLVMSAWYSRGSLRIPRDMIVSISPSSGDGSKLYEGPVDPKKWSNTVAGGNGVVINGRAQVQQRIIRGGLLPNGFPGAAGGNGWSFSKGKFMATRSNSITGRKIKYADLTSVAFEVEWQGSMSFTMQLFANKVATYGASGYKLTLTPYNANLTRSQIIGGSARDQGLGSANVNLRGKNKAQVTMLVDRPNRNFSLLIDGRLVKQWKDSGDFAGTGDFITLLHQTNALIKVGKILVTEWDGSLPSADGAAAKLKEDVIALKDSKTTGKLLGIRNGNVEFEANNIGLIRPPVDKVKILRLAGVEKREPVIIPGDVKLTLATGGEFVINLTSWTADSVKGRSNIFGRVELLPSAFAAVEFNLHKKEDDGGGDDPFDNE